MASGSGRSVAGCSGCLVLIFLMLTAFFAMAPQFMYDMDLPAAVYSLLGFSAIGQYASSTCCCLSGVGMIVGIAMLLMGGKNE